MHYLRDDATDPPIGNGGSAFGINDGGVATGYAYFNVPALFFSQMNGYRWSGNEVDRLPTPDHHFSTGNKINSAGTVAGNLVQQAAVWSGSEVQVLAGYPSEAFDINDRGHAVGFYRPQGYDRGFVWDGSRLIDLTNALEPSSQGWTIDSAHAINDRGQILARGTRNGAHRSLRLDPVDWLLDQWHLEARSVARAGANVRAAWTLTQGAGINIAIIDTGLEWTHPDLQPNYVSSSSWDFNDNDSDPAPLPGGDHAHGTRIAGIAAAHGTRASGVAPRASISGLRLRATPTPGDAQEAAALSHLPNVIDIANNSWGGRDGESFLDAPGPLARAAIESAITEGRNGRGRIFVWAAGNGGEHQENCNFDGYANSRYAIAVGAIRDVTSGAHPDVEMKAPYSEACSALFVSAPSGGGPRDIATTSSGGAYVTNVSGTSAAAPIVSGAIALMLSRNPNLTWRDVQYILRQSSHRLRPNDAGWTVDPLLHPLAHNEKYGFGQLDVHAAVQMAKAWMNVPPEVALPPITRTLNVRVPDADEVMDTITIGPVEANFVIEHVEVVFTATHSYRGDLRVTLSAPNGVVSTLATDRNDPGDDFNNWRFMSVRHWGASPVGDWTLRVADVIGPNVGTFNSWTLHIYGYRRAFTDHSLDSGVTQIKVVHVTELRFRINAARATCGLGPAEFTPITAGVPLIRAVHVTEMRTALNEAYAVCGRQQLSFTDPSLTPGVVPVKAIHLTELRNGVMGLE
jgi:subtilisin-like proprotein convertase family protein